MSASLPPHIPRLHRLQTVFTSTPFYFLTFCTDNRRPLLATSIVHSAFRTFCHTATAHGAQVGRYVLMPDHVHLFVTFAPESLALSAWVKSLKTSLSKTLRAQNITAPHWQKGFFDHVMRSADSYSEKWDYVRANPVRAGLVATPEAWPYQGTSVSDAGPLAPSVAAVYDRRTLSPTSSASIGDHRPPLQPAGLTPP